MSSFQGCEIYMQDYFLDQKGGVLGLFWLVVSPANAQIYSRLDTLAEATNINFAQISQRFERIETVQAEQSQQLAEILRILRDRNGGSGL